MPMGEQPGLATGDTAEPVFSATSVPPEPFVFPHGPSDQVRVEMAKHRVQGGLVETPVVLNPAPQDRIPHACQVVMALSTLQGKLPAPHLLSHPRRRLLADRRTEVDEVSTPSILRSTSTERIPQKVELRMGMLAPSVLILAVDDTRLLRMHLQPTVLEATLDAAQDLLRLLPGPAVRHYIIRIALERNIRMRTTHPLVERQVQEDISQKRTGYTALRCPRLPRDLRAVLPLYRGFKPPLT